MSNAYYSDGEIIEMIEVALVNSVEADRIASLVRDRFSQKDKQPAFQASRLRTAAEHIGFTMIDELQSYE